MKLGKVVEVNVPSASPCSFIKKSNDADAYSGD